MATSSSDGILDSKFFSIEKLTILLDDSNYLLWRQQVLLAIKTHKLQCSLDGQVPPPSAIVIGDDGMIQENPEFVRYEQQDNALASWLLSLVS